MKGLATPSNVLTASSDSLKKNKKKVEKLTNVTMDVDIESGELEELCNLNIATTPRLAPNLQALLGTVFSIIRPYIPRK